MRNSRGKPVVTLVSADGLCVEIAHSAKADSIEMKAPAFLPAKRIADHRFRKARASLRIHPNAGSRNVFPLSEMFLPNLSQCLPRAFDGNLFGKQLYVILFANII